MLIQTQNSKFPSSWETVLPIIQSLSNKIFWIQTSTGYKSNRSLLKERNLTSVQIHRGCLDSDTYSLRETKNLGRKKSLWCKLRLKQVMITTLLLMILKMNCMMSLLKVTTQTSTVSTKTLNKLVWHNKNGWIGAYLLMSFRAVLSWPISHHIFLLLMPN